MKRSIHSIKQFLMRVATNAPAIGKQSLVAGTSLFAILGIVGLFFDLPNIFSSNLCKLAVIFGIVLVSCMIGFFHAIWKQETIVIEANGGHKLTMRYGDLLASTARIKVIAVNRCFDTIVDDKFVSVKSIHGQWIRQIMKEISLQELDAKIEAALSTQTYSSEIERINKEGKSLRYPVGSIAEIRINDQIYYLLGLTKFDQNQNASCSEEEYLLAIQRLMEYYDKHSQGYEIDIALMGTGFSRMPQDDKEILEIMLALIRFNNRHLVGNINLIISKKMRSRISINI